jgi:hypothetical protein
LAPEAAHRIGASNQRINPAHQPGAPTRRIDPANIAAAASPPRQLGRGAPASRHCHITFDFNVIALIK